MSTMTPITDSTTKLPTSATISEAAMALLIFKGKQLSLQGYEPFKAVYDCSPDTLVLKAGRQIGKSLSLAAILLTNLAMRSYYNSLYVAPLSVQAARFSGLYLDPFFNSPLLKKYFTNSSSKKNVFEKSLSNGSHLYLSYVMVESDADRIRGLALNALYIDEIQDISIEALPVLKETMSAADEGTLRLTGTAKSINNTLEISFRRSSMGEWCVRCESCGKWTIPIDHETCLKILENPEGPGCVHCGKVLDMSKGKWMMAHPDRVDNLGFHLPQLIFPARTNPKKWKELRQKVVDYPAQKLSNEVFGLASGVGDRILSMKEAMACTNPSRTEWDTGFPVDSRHILYAVLGVDWSVSGSTKSYTVISVFGYDSLGKCYLLYCQRLNGVDILEQVARVEQVYRQFKCTQLASDRGVGVLQAQLLQTSLGMDRVHMIQYVAAKHALRWDQDGGFFSADRTRAMDTMVIKAKLGRDRFETPAWSISGTFWQDALNVFEEESQMGRRLYRKDEDATDDALHSWVFCNLAGMILTGEYKYLDQTNRGEEVPLIFA